MDQSLIIETLIKWVLGLLTLAIIGILSMYVKLSIIRQRLLDHIKECEKAHKSHCDSFSQVWDAIDVIREKASK